MKAIVQRGYGGAEVLRLTEVDTPRVGEDGVLVRVHASSVNPYDWHFMRGVPYLARLDMGLRRPRNTIPGADMAGTVEAVGRKVTRWRVGDEVYGELDGGAFAEYVCVREDVLGPKPAALTFEEAAAVPMGALTALQALRDVGGIRPGHKVLITGASGGVGSFAVQLAKAFGAEVTGVCGTDNVAMVRRLGADHVLDHTRDTFTHPDKRYDIFLDNAGTHTTGEARRAVTPNGTLIPNNGSTGGPTFGPMLTFLSLPLRSRLSSQTLKAVQRRSNTTDLTLLRDLMEERKVTPIIARTYPLADVPHAILDVERGHTGGKIAISV